MARAVLEVTPGPAAEPPDASSLGNEVQRLTSPEAARRAAALLGWIGPETPEGDALRLADAVRARVSAGRLGDSRFIQVTVSDVNAERAGEGTVVLAGQSLTYGDPNGWQLKQADQVELVGTACEQIRAGEDDLDIGFPCAVFKPVVK